MNEKLLQKVVEKRKLYYEKNPDRKAEYNIFKVLEVTEKEVILCRMLADLLNPYGYHKYGSIFLKLFLEEVLQIKDFTEQELSVAEVYKEYQLWFRIEVEEHLYAGFCLFDPLANGGEGEQVDEISEDIKQILKKYINVNVVDNEYWWVKWIYLPTGTHETGIGENAVPNFKYMNEGAIALADRKVCELFVKKALEKIKETLFSVLMITSNNE